MNEKDWVYEGMMARMERSNRRSFILNIVLALMLFAGFVAVLEYESQFEVTETTTIEATQDGEGVNIVGMGDVNYGAESSNYKD